MRVYLDTCCYNRAVEESEQENMKAESEAVNYILASAQENGDVIIGSDAIHDEINDIHSEARKSAVQEKYSAAGEYVAYDEAVNNRTYYFMFKANVHEKDARHLACAEKGEANVFLTTDYRLIKASFRLKLNFQVMNPVCYADCLRKT
ncbi:MAG: hypothetical protein IJS28_08030 [Synergistaceae bacterium]|nr:hypothetical protein [Synergistaceae bacterium]